MKLSKVILLISISQILTSCSGGPGGIGNFFNSSPGVIPASQVETAKLQAALKNEPAYKLDNSEIATLQSEGIINEADKAKLQSIQ